MSAHTRRNLNSILIFSLFTSLGTVIYSVANHGLKISPLAYHFIAGLLFGIITSVAEIYFFEDRLKRMHFSAALIIRSSFYLIISSLLIISLVSTEFGKESRIFAFNPNEHGSIFKYVTSIDFAELIVLSIIMSFFVNFVRQINRMLGQNVLFNFLRGKYQLPLEEELIFMFLDLKSSTTIAEKIGLKKNHEFLNDFFHDITDPILINKGNIYQYVGDEIVITWHLKNGLKDQHCINCFFDIQKKINSLKENYIKKYGIYPEFKAGLHSGLVITGEMGDIKKDIVYHGDTINTAARIQGECNKYNKKLLVSKTLLEKLNMDSKFKTESMGNIRLRGRATELELFSVEEN